MKTLRLVSSPTRSRRLNEIFGLILLVGAGLMLLALASYDPVDPSFDTVGGTGAAVHGIARNAHNWTGLAGAYFADAILQVLGIAAFFLPLLFVRIGVCWMRSRPAGSGSAKVIALALWVTFAPAAVSLLPGHLLWRGALPIAGLSGLIVGDALVALLNLPGASIVVALMVALSLYLATTFTFSTAREWATERFGFLATLRNRWLLWRGRSALEPESRDDSGEEFGSRRAKLDQAAREEAERERGEADVTAADIEQPRDRGRVGDDGGILLGGA